MRVELPDSSELESGELVKLVLQADSARRQLDGYLTSLLGRLGDLEGQDAAEELCRQFALGRHRARQQAKTAGALKALPTTLEALRSGWISIDHARAMGESHVRAPLNQAQELELITLAISEDLDVFKGTLARSEDQRRADEGLTRHERQRERRSGRVFDGENDIPNLVLPCPKCHTKVHKHGYSVAKDLDGRHRLTPESVHLLDVDLLVAKDLDGRHRLTPPSAAPKERCHEAQPKRPLPLRSPALFLRHTTNP